MTVVQFESQVIDRVNFLRLLNDDGPWEGRTSAIRTSVNVIRQTAASSGVILIDLGDVAEMIGVEEAGQLKVTVGYSLSHSIETARNQVLAKLDDVLQAARAVVVSIRGPQGLSLEKVLQASDLVYQAVGSITQTVFGAREEEWLDDQYCIVVIAFNEELS